MFLPLPPGKAANGLGRTAKTKSLLRIFRFFLHLPVYNRSYLTTVVVMGERIKISEAEWKAMEIVWQSPPVSAQDVIIALEGETGWKPQTIKTLLARLVKKGALRTEAQGTRYLYHPEFTREAAIAAETDSFLGRVCRGSLAPMLTYFAESGRKLDSEEADILRQLLEQDDNLEEEGTSGK